MFHVRANYDYLVIYIYIYRLRVNLQAAENVMHHAKENLYCLSAFRINLSKWYVNLSSKTE